MRLGDVADVLEDHQPLIGDATQEGERSLMLVIERFPDADVAHVTADVEEALQAMSAGLTGITVDTDVYRPASYLESADAAGAGRRHRAPPHADHRRPAHLVVADGVITFGSVATSVAAALYVLRLGDAPLTTMTLLGLATVAALIVDDVVGDVSALSGSVPRGAGRQGIPPRALIGAAVVAPSRTTGLRDAHRLPRARAAAVPHGTGRRVRPARTADLRPRGAGLVRRGHHGHACPRRPARPSWGGSTVRPRSAAGCGRPTTASAPGRTRGARRRRPRRPRGARPGRTAEPGDGFAAAPAPGPQRAGPAGGGRGHVAGRDGPHHRHRRRRELRELSRHRIGRHARRPGGSAPTRWSTWMPARSGSPWPTTRTTGTRSTASAPSWPLPGSARHGEHLRRRPDGRCQCHDRDDRLVVRVSGEDYPTSSSTAEDVQEA